MKKIFKNKCANKLYAIKHGDFYYERSFVWYDQTHAMLGTKRQMTILLNNDLYQFKIRGARVVKVK